MVQERASARSRQATAAKKSMHLSGHRLRVARAAWLALAALSLGISIAMVPASLAAYQTICASGACQLTPQQAHALLHLGISIQAYALANVALSVVFLLVSCALAAIIVWRKSNHWMALLVALLLVALGGIPLANSLESTAQPWYVGATLIDKIDLGMLLLIFTLFPSGRFVPRWVGWLPAAWLAIQVPLALLPAPPVPDWLLGLAYLGFFGAVILAQIYRYRLRSNPTERRQTKWVVLGIVVTLLVDIVLWQFYVFVPGLQASDSIYPVFAEDIFKVIAFLIPASFAIAVLRDGLYDIDIIINRALVYGTLTTLLAGIYFGVVLGAQSIIHALTRSTDQPPLLVVLTTLLIAALVQPLRRAIQTFIDKRFFRPRYDAAATLAAFGRSVRSEVDLEPLRDHLLDVIDETMRPKSAWLWLRAPAQAPRR